MHPLVSAIIKQLEVELATAIQANDEAHSSATHSENIATSRYDTLALEAAYLAHGQSIRIAEFQESIALYRHYKWPDFNQQSTTIQMGALVSLENSEGATKHLFLGPSAGGLTITKKSTKIQVLTPNTPLGKALMNKMVGDEIKLKFSSPSLCFTVIGIE